jgi:hypothetical protein
MTRSSEYLPGPRPRSRLRQRRELRHAKSDASTAADSGSSTPNAPSNATTSAAAAPDADASPMDDSPLAPPAHPRSRTGSTPPFGIVTERKTEYERKYELENNRMMRASYGGAGAGGRDLHSFPWSADS